MKRREFSKQTRRDALRRSGQVCEAVGVSYGLPANQRCQTSLAYGVEFHHAKEAELGGDNSLENCAAICIKCHRFVTRGFIKELRHSDRVRDRHQGIARPKSKLSREYRREVQAWRARMEANRD